MNNKPKYLYHGSQYYFEVLKPQQANGACDRESMLAIYAAETMDEVITFALPIRWYPDNPSGKRVFECEKGLIKLLYGSINPDGIGYVYKIKSDDFIKIDEWQWISKNEIIPEEVMEISVRDYWEWIEMSEEAKKIHKELYGEDSLFSERICEP